MRWVYILQCKDDYYYVGETTRLFRRFWEHECKLGGLNTQIYPVKQIVAIYSVQRLSNFFIYEEKISKNDYKCGYNMFFHRGGLIENFNDNEDDDNVYEYSYDSRTIENIIAEKIMLDNASDWTRIRGGKYVRFDVTYPFPKTNRYINSLPSCHCGLPCDIRKNDDDELYFRCAKKNIWTDMQELFQITPEPCTFFKKYDKDIEYKKQYQERKGLIQQLIGKSYWLKTLAGGQYEFCVGGCGKEYDSENTIRYAKRAINLCFDCFIDKNDELSKKYKLQKVKRLLSF